jgi:HD-like signal output (HDOD) protein
MTMIDLDRLVQSTTELAPLPASTVRLAQVVSSPGSHLEEVVELISFDQALTVKLLRAANSAASGSTSHIGTVQEAVMRIGTAQVMTLAVASSAKSMLQSRVPAYGLDEGTLWRHSVAAAVSAEVAAGFCRVDVPPETFTAALLHDIGKLVMGRFLSPEILDFIHSAQQIDHLGQLEAESLLLGVNHGELGGLVAQHWKLPPRVVQGIIYHHNPVEGNDVICQLTYLSNVMAKHIEAQLDHRKYEIEIIPEAAECLLPTKKIEDFASSAVTRYEKVSCRYNAV